VRRARSFETVGENDDGDPLIARSSVVLMPDGTRRMMSVMPDGTVRGHSAYLTGPPRGLDDPGGVKRWRSGAASICTFFAGQSLAVTFPGTIGLSDPGRNSLRFNDGRSHGYQDLSGSASLSSGQRTVVLSPRGSCIDTGAQITKTWDISVGAIRAQLKYTKKTDALRISITGNARGFGARWCGLVTRIRGPLEAQGSFNRVITPSWLLETTATVNELRHFSFDVPITSPVQIGPRSNFLTGAAQVALTTNPGIDEDPLLRWDGDLTAVFDVQAGVELVQGPCS
jgi:hypothetical protein